VSLLREIESMPIVELSRLSIDQWKKRSLEVDDLHAQLSWAYQFIADSLGMTLDPNDESLPVVNLALEDTPENEMVRTVFGVGHGHLYPDSLNATLLDVMKVLALCFELSMRAEGALHEVMRMQAMMSLKELQG
jgi:hypothetical protein